MSVQPEANKAPDFPCTVPAVLEKSSPATEAKPEKFCRICMDDETGNPLISPCRCSGSLQFIHEECLKTWLASKSEDMDAVKCEICNTPFLMNLIVERHCSPREACKDGLTHCLFIPLLCAVQVMLCLIVYVLCVSMAEGDDELGYSVALLITCSISSVVIVLLLFKAIREACLSSKLEEWKIYDQIFENEPVHENVLPEPFEISVAADPPPFIRVKGRKVKTQLRASPLRRNLSGPVSPMIQSAIPRSMTRNINLENGASPGVALQSVE